MNNGCPDIPGYQVEAEIGRGGMGVVYRVRQRATGATLALKMNVHGRGASFHHLARFRIEAEALACLNHPNIVKIRDVGLYAGYPFFAMDFAIGGSLKQTISQGPVQPMKAVALVRTLALAMQHAHERGMLHQNLKPANVLLMADGTPVVTDFGLVKFARAIDEVSDLFCTRSVSALDSELARLAHESDSQYRPVPEGAGEEAVTLSYWEQCAARTGVLGDSSRFKTVRAFLSDARQQSRQAAPKLDGLTHAGAVMGSPNYMAPEQAIGELDRIGPRTDVYGLGGILYELLTAHPPFRSGSVIDLLNQACNAAPTPPRETMPDLSSDIELVCLKCLRKSPDTRYQSAADLAVDLLRIMEGYEPWGEAATCQAAQPASPTATTEFPATVNVSAPPLPDRASPTRSWWPFGKRDRKAKGEST